MLVVILISTGIQVSQGVTQVDPDPDGLGIYFDLEATVNCNTVPMAEMFDLYLLLTNASASGGVSGWECQIQYDPDLWVLLWYPVGYSGSFFTPPDFALGLVPPLPWAPVIHLLTMTCIVFSPECLWLSIVPYSNPIIPGEIVYADGSDPWNLITMHPSTGGFDIPVAGVNCDCPPPIETTAATWGSMKALYH